MHSFEVQKMLDKQDAFCANWNSFLRAPQEVVGMRLMSQHSPPLPPSRRDGLTIFVSVAVLEGFERLSGPSARGCEDTPKVCFLPPYK